MVMRLSLLRKEVSTGGILLNRSIVKVVITVVSIKRVSTIERRIEQCVRLGRMCISIRTRMVRSFIFSF